MLLAARLQERGAALEAKKRELDRELDENRIERLETHRKLLDLSLQRGAALAESLAGTLQRGDELIQRLNTASKKRKSSAGRGPSSGAKSSSRQSLALQSDAPVESNFVLFLVLVVLLVLVVPHSDHRTGCCRAIRDRPGRRLA